MPSVRNLIAVRQRSAKPWRREAGKRQLASGPAAEDLHLILFTRMVSSIPSTFILHPSFAE